MNNKRKVSCPFGLLNIGGLMETKPILKVDDEIGAEVTTPLFCHDTYKIKPTLNANLNNKFAYIHIEGDVNDGKYYQKKFRRMVLWDFGDGYTEEGYSVEHSYSKPGRYKITCTFYDINRVAWKNDYHIYVTVKEVIPTQLVFDKNYTKTEIKCSKIERIARLETMLSLTTKDDLQVKAQRIFTEEEEDTNYEEIGRNYKEIEDSILKFSERYWTFLENKQQLIFQSDKIYGDNLNPQDLFTPNYISLYGKFYYDNSIIVDENGEERLNDEPIKLQLYQVIPYKNIDDNLKTIRVLNPNCLIDDLLNDDSEEYFEKFTKVIEIQQVYIEDQLPEDATFIGKRAFVDIFYKNDYLTTDNHDNVFSFYYDIEHINITKELKTSDNYLNINPLGLSIRTIPNKGENVKMGVSLDCFLREIDESDDWSEKSYYVDPYLREGLVKDIDLDFYFFPYIEYKTEQSILEVDGIEIESEIGSDFVTSSKMYYVPKDVTITNIDLGYNTDKNLGTESTFNNMKVVTELQNWLWRVPLTLFDYIDISFNVKFDMIGSSHQIDVPIKRDKLINPDELNIPTEKMVKENISELVETYMAHPMFDETDNIKEFFKTILNGKNLINYTLTKSKNFLNDYANVKTCYLSALISTLKMMGEDIYEYEKGGFEGVNDLRDFVRLLTINHSDLVGHVIGEQLDTTVRLDRKGRNVSDEIKVDDILTLQAVDTNHNKGKILTLSRDGSVYDYRQLDKNGVDVIVQDKYTYDTKVVNFRLAEHEGTIQIMDYRPSWGWNLLLPKSYDDCLYKLDKNEQYKKEHNGRNLYSTSDLTRLRQVMKDTLGGYYAFYILDPKVDNRRVGNFLEESTITDRINSVEDWDNKWGICHEIMMKILRDNGGLKHTKYVIEDDMPQMRTMRLMDDDKLCGIIEQEISSIRTSVYEDSMLAEETRVSALVKVYGVICEETEQWLELQLSDCVVTDDNLTTDIKTVEPNLLFKVKVDDEGVIHPTKQVYEVSGGQYKGTLTVALCGKLKKEKGEIKGFMWDVTLDIFS